MSVWNGDNYAYELMGRFGLQDSGGAVRASLVLYNTAADVDRLLEAVAELGVARGRASPAAGASVALNRRAPAAGGAPADRAPTAAPAASSCAASIALVQPGQCGPAGAGERDDVTAAVGLVADARDLPVSTRAR